MKLKKKTRTSVLIMSKKGINISIEHRSKYIFCTMESMLILYFMKECQGKRHNSLHHLSFMLLLMFIGILDKRKRAMELELDKMNPFFRFIRIS